MLLRIPNRSNQPFEHFHAYITTKTPIAAANTPPTAHPIFPAAPVEVSVDAELDLEAEPEPEAVDEVED